jgi:hypothetical protein
MSTPISPPARRDHAFAYDPLLQKCILFGGAAGSAPTVFVDTWEWDGANWQQRTPATTPHWRGSASLTFDANRGRLALVAGWAYIGGGWNVVTDHWEWDGTNWVMLDPNIPYPRAASVSFFDSGRNRLVEFGGYTNWIYNSNETREFDGTTWTAVPVVSPPSGRLRSAGFYDTWRGAAVMHGGFTSFGIGPASDTWLFTSVGAATVTSYGPGCAGPAGTMALQVVQRPVLQTSFTLNVANVDPMAVPVIVIGLSPLALSIAGVFGAGPSCVLRASTEIIEILPPSLSWSLAIPNNPTLLGFAIHNQVAQFTYDAPSNTYGTSLSNAVRSTLGSF